MPLIVEDLMTPSPHTVHPDATIHRVVQLMRAHNLHHVPVLDIGGRVVGVVSHRGLLDRGLARLHREDEADLQEVQTTTRTAEVMTRTLHTVHPETPLEQAGSMMMLNGYSCLPVTTVGRVVGILTTTDFVRWLTDHAPALSPDAQQEPRFGAHWTL